MDVAWETVQSLQYAPYHVPRTCQLARRFSFCHPQKSRAMDGPHAFSLALCLEEVHKQLLPWLLCPFN